MQSFRQYVADDRGVTTLVVGLMAALLVPVGISAYYFVQQSASKGILTTVCQRVLGAYIEADSSVKRASAMSAVIDGLIQESVIKDVTTSVMMVGGVETFAKGDPEANRPIYELKLNGTDVAASGSDSGGKIGTTCKARLEYRRTYGFVEYTRRLKVLAGAPPSLGTRWLLADLADMTTDDMQFFVRQTIGTEYLDSEIWSRNDGNRNWIFPEDTNSDGTLDELRLSGTFGASDATLRGRIRPAYFVALTPHDSSKVWIKREDESTPDGFPAIKPRCYDPEDPDDDDGFGWEPDPKLMPGGSGEGEIGTITNDGGYKYIAIVGFDQGGKHDPGGTTWDDWDNWEVYSSTGGYNKVGDNFFSVKSGFNSGHLQIYTPFSRTPNTNYWEIGTWYTRYVDGAYGVSSRLQMHELAMKVSCREPFDARVAVPVKS